MMNAAVGSRYAVTGNNSAMVSAGPIPGSTPIAVPSAEPTRAQNRLIGCRATLKPLSRESSVPMSESHCRQQAAELDSECREAEPADHAEGDADHRVEQVAARSEGARDE